MPDDATPHGERPEGPVRPSPPNAAIDRMQESLVRRMGGQPLVPTTTLDCATPRSDAWRAEVPRSAAHPHALGRFEIESVLGAGAMGTVYAAHDPLLQRRVAVKLLHADLASVAALARVYREAQALARLSHPHVVQVFAIGHHAGVSGADDVFVAMEYIEGQTLDRWRAEAEPSTDAIVEAYAQAGRGLHALHGVGLVHRDFKPTNVMRDAEGRVRVLDLGLVRGEAAPRPAELEPRTISAPLNLDSSKTDSNALLGTPAYMAPEQFLGAPATPVSDQFSFCVALWEALHGERPFRASTPYELIEAVTEGRLVLPEATAGVPARILRALERGLSCNPDDRHPSMAALLHRLQRSPQRRAVYLASGVAIVALAAVVAPAVAGSNAGCPPVREVDRTWNAGTRAALQDAATGVDAAATPGIVARIDAYAHGLREEAASACEAGEGPRAAARDACVSRHIAALRAVVEVLVEHPNANPSARDEIVDRLRDPSCADAVAVVGGPALPVDPQARADVHEAQRLGERAVALGMIPDLDGATAAASEAVAVARRSGHPPALAEALNDRGHVSIRRGDHEAALLDMTAAHEISVEAHNDGAAAHHALSALWLTMRAGRLDDAQRWAREAHSRAEAARPDPDRRARLQHRRGQLAYTLGDIEEAGRLLSDARERFEALGDARELATVLTDLSPVLSARGDHDGAVEATSRAIELLREAFGDDDPQIATHYLNLGNAEQLRDHDEAALAAFSEALARREKAFPASHPQVGLAAYSTATALTDLERYGEALAMLDRVRTILPPAHFGHAASFLVEGQILARQGRPEAAASTFDRGVRGLEDAMGPDHPAVAQARSERDEALKLAGSDEPEASAEP